MSHDSSTLIIFDWDDTLLPSHWLSERGLIVGSDNPALPEVRDLTFSVQVILEHAQKYGTVVIITNAESGWVAHSCAKFMPDVMPLISTIKTVSARSLFEPLRPDSPTEWKKVAFQQEAAAFTNVISIGDSESERYAVKTLAGPDRLTKSLKVLERSAPGQMAAQLDLIASMLEMIVTHKHSIDVCCHEA